MTGFSPQQRRTFWLLMAGTALLTLWGLGRLPLLDVDEPVYGAVGRAMASSHSWADWLTPHYNGALWFDKPPLFYWLTAISMRLWGAGEMAARLPSALAGMGTVATTVALARRAYPQHPAGALWAGFVLATGVQFFLLSRAAVTDMALALTLTLALLGLYAWLDGGRGIVSTGVMTGLACLVKGPVALVLIGVQLLLFLGWTRGWLRLKSPVVWLSFALCLTVAVPWYAAMMRLHGQAFVQGFLQTNNVTRFLQAEHKETNNPLWYVPIFLAFFLPWTVAVPGALRAAVIRNRAERQGAGDVPRPTLFLLLWCGLVFVFFSVSQTKLVTYIFPLFPAMAVLTGRWIAEKAAQPVRVSRVPMFVFAVLLVILAALLTIAGAKFHVSPWTLAVWLAALLCGAAWCVWGKTTSGRWLAPGVAVSLVLLAAWLSPTWNMQADALSERRPARVAGSLTPLGEAIYALGLKHPSLAYYSGRDIVYTDSREASIADMAAHPAHVYALRPKVLQELQTRYGLRGFRLVYVSPQTCLVTGSAHMTAFARPQD